MVRRAVLSWGKLIDRFLVESEIGGMTDATLKTYRWTLDQAAEYFGPDTDPLALTEGDLYDLLSHWSGGLGRKGAKPRTETKLSTTTMAGRISIIHSFFRWASKKYKVKDPAVEIERPKKRKVARRRLTAGQMESMYRNADSDRDKLIVAILWMTGMRRAELIAARWRDVDVNSELLRIPQGKGRKGREVPLPSALTVILGDRVARLQEAGEYTPEGYVCPRTRIVVGPVHGGVTETVDHLSPMGETTINKAVKRAAAAAGIPSPNYVGPHDLRRGYATLFLTWNPGDIQKLSQILGHANISTTQIYLADAEAPAVGDAVRRVHFDTTPGAPDTIPGGLIHLPTKREMGVDAPDFGEPIG